MSESATLSLQERWLGYAQAAESWLRNDLLTVETGTIVTIQLAVVIAALLAGRWIGRGLYPAAERAIKPLPEGMAAGLAAIFKAGLSPTFQAGLLGIGVVGLGMVDQPAAIVRIAFGLAGVWLLIRTTSLFIRNQTIRIYLRRIALVIAGLYAIGVLDDIMDWLNRTGISFGGKLVTLPSKQLVVGDLLHLEAGNKVPADLRLLKTFSLKIDESSLTGESITSDKKMAAAMMRTASTS